MIFLLMMFRCSDFHSPLTVLDPRDRFIVQLKLVGLEGNRADDGDLPDDPFAVRLTHLQFPSSSGQYRVYSVLTPLNTMVRVEIHIRSRSRNIRVKYDDRIGDGMLSRIKSRQNP